MSLLDRVDWSKVTAAASEYGIEAVSSVAAVEKAARRWLAYDYKRLDGVSGIEELIEASGHERRDYKGIIDLWGWYDRRLQIIDWKTTRTLDARWKMREERSSQGAWYVLLLLAAKRVPSLREEIIVDIEFRGVQNPDAKTIKTASQTLRMGDIIAFDAELNQWEEMFSGLAKDWWWPWPKNAPEGCRPFGDQRPCINEDICFGGYDFLLQGEQQPKKKLSFSTLKEFRRCPERLRLNTLRSKYDPTPTKESDESRFGKAFHAGIAEVYRQIFRTKGAH